MKRCRIMVVGPGLCMVAIDLAGDRLTVYVKRDEQWWRQEMEISG